VTDEELQAETIRVMREIKGLYATLDELLVEGITRRVLRDYPDARELRLASPYDNPEIQLYLVECIVLRDGAVVKSNQMSNDLYNDVVANLGFLAADHSIGQYERIVFDDRPVPAPT
jgi:hypothetical protein